MSLNAYHRALVRAETPRATEHRLIREITSEMMLAQELGMKGAQLMPALHRNREMWSTFGGDCAVEGNGLPGPLRAQIISLSLWVERHTSLVMKGGDTIDALIDLNRTIMEGLMGERMAA